MLAVARDADQQAIKDAFRQLALRYHPDCGSLGIDFEEDGYSCAGPGAGNLTRSRVVHHVATLHDAPSRSAFRGPPIEALDHKASDF